jgi:hypothetical protein
MPLPVRVSIGRDGLWMVRELKQQVWGNRIDVDVNMPWSACSRVMSKILGARWGRTSASKRIIKIESLRGMKCTHDRVCAGVE